MADGRMALWLKKHYVGFNIALALLWLAFAVTHLIPIANGNSGINGGHVFGLVLGLLTAILCGTSAVIAFTSKRKKTTKRSSQRAEH